MTGFEFRVDPNARLADKRLLLAAAERRLGDELDRRAKELVDAPDDLAFIVEEDGGLAVGWADHVLARLAGGRSLLDPAFRTARALDRLSAPSRAALRERLERWLDAQIDRHLRPLKKLAAAATDPASSPGVRALAAMLADAGGCCRARPCSAPSPISNRPTAKRCIGCGSGSVRSMSSCRPLLKPAAQPWRAALSRCARASDAAIAAAGAATLGP